MKKIIGTIILVLVLVPLVFTAGEAGSNRGKGKEDPVSRGYVIVKFRANAPEADKGKARERVSGRKGRKLKRAGIEKVHIPPGWDEEMAVEMLSRDPSVESAQVDYKVELLAAPVLLGVMSTLVPNDPFLGDQWYLDAVPIKGTFANAGTVNVDVDIDAPEGWYVVDRTFDTSMTAAVGVIDSGCGELGTFDTTTGYDPGHSDLPNSVLFANTAELPADGADTTGDTNLMRDDANGWDFADVDNIPADDITAPVATYHGTLISGIIGAAWDNGQRGAGIGKGQLQVLPLRFTDSFFDVVNAVEYAMDLVDDGHAVRVRVLNMSFKSANGIDPNGLSEAVAMAGNPTYRIAVVAAAGNDNGNNNDDFINRVWPAEYTRDPSIASVLAVAATGTNGALAGFSNIGPNSVQIAAPGDNIYSTYGGSADYAYGNGTSFSTPIAGAVLGLVMAAYPELLPAEAIDRVIKGGDFDARLAGLVQSGKRVNLAGALAPFYPYSGLAYLDSAVTVSMYADTINQQYGTMVNAIIDPVFSTSPDAAVIVAGGGGSWAVSPLAPGITQFTLNFDGASAPVGTYDTGPWRVTAIRPFTAQLLPNETVSFSSLISGDITWAVSDTSVATIDSNGVLTGLSKGMTRVILSVAGVETDYSGQVLVLSSSTSSSGSSGGGCGITSSPGDPYISELIEMMLVGMMLVMLRRRWMAVPSPMSKAQSPK
ncbi:MAG: S8 family serine peptidase [bacterium]|nr:S8 family serine peptidase [bacterium]